MALSVCVGISAGPDGGAWWGQAGMHGALGEPSEDGRIRPQMLVP